MEFKLECNIDQCKTLADNLTKTTENFKLKKIQSLEKEAKFSQENEELRWKYDCKLRQLQKMEEEYSTKVCWKNRSIAQYLCLLYKL